MSNPTRIILFAGGNLGDWALEEVEAGDCLVGVDRGALFLIRHGLRPRLSIGDFDSVTPEEWAEISAHSEEVRSCDPVLKDMTDTEMGFVWALDQGAQEIVLTGALGSRFDHTLANVHLLWKGLRSGVRCRIVDAANDIMLVDRELTLGPSRFPHISLLPLTPEVTGITLSGFQYPLEHATLRLGDTLGISNVLTADSGTISVASGCLLVIRSKD
ncbi:MULTISPECIES: thiamine diphosphokinase [Brevibacillus]|jgi:thiamine pyrophosphokinase|uniref:thiamine diphosphokinase n=1 Tax=Brevibacillus TaxID=55080 RepID=UPI000E383AC9|nr:MULTISPECIES: thiamine diphosphokinase [Bacillales]MBR8661737.1 thiamine diphosphokinase [Brevibacillus sp. NL20B1]MDT3416578.1 thiamine pyrophosphokinase [Brevibacillus aydinogluensis]REK60685.1 MAG: thiamine diphosphokinase [Brevibacillus sp.]UFJ62101.1 thiamine diphosphokinase [Anoxybacillus sediminis]